MICANCNRTWAATNDENWGFNLQFRRVEDQSLCSLDCVIEYAWKLREAQPKLSKSKVDNAR